MKKVNTVVTFSICRYLVNFRC